MNHHYPLSFAYLNPCPRLKIKFVCDFWHYPAPEGIATNINRLIRARISQNKVFGMATSAI